MTTPAIRRQILRRLEPRAKALYLQMPQYAKAATPEKRKGIARRTPKRAKEERQYRARVPVWLNLPENLYCAACPIIFGYQEKSTQCHHVRGRRNGLLLLEKFWKPVCQHCHDWIHHNIAHARELGLLAPIGQWNTMPKD